MRIAVNTRFLLSSKMEGFGWYTYEVVKRLVNEHPEHEFYFFFDRKFDEKFVFGTNVTPVVLHPQARHPLLFKIWFNISVKKALKKYKIDLFFSPDGFLSLRTKVPQIGVIHDINFEHNPEDIPKSALKYLTKYFPRFARKAKHIITVSEYSKQDLVNTYEINPSKITVSWNGASDVFQPLTEEVKLRVREKISGGIPYLIFVGALHPRKNVPRLVDAFVKMRESRPDLAHRLVIVGEQLFHSSFSSFKIPKEYATEILFTGHLSLNELAEAVGSATALAFVPYFEGFGIPLVEAMKCGTPILSGNRTSLPEVAGEAAIYCDPYSVEDIQEKMTLLCSDENLQASLKVKGLERSREFSWDRSAATVWEVIERSMNN